MGQRLDRFKENVRHRCALVKQFVENNPEVVVAGSIVGTKILWEAGRAAKRNQIYRLERDKQCRVYDPALGVSYRLKRPLTNDEILEYKLRLASGEDRYDILRNLGALK